MDVNLHFHQNVTNDVLQILEKILKKVEHMSAELDRLEVEVSENTDVIESAILLIEGISDQLEAAKLDPVKIQALADSLDTEANKLAAAVAAHTVAAPTE